VLGAARPDRAPWLAHTPTACPQIRLESAVAFGQGGGVCQIPGLVILDRLGKLRWIDLTHGKL